MTLSKRVPVDRMWGEVDAEAPKAISGRLVDMHSPTRTLLPHGHFPPAQFARAAIAFWDNL